MSNRWDRTIGGQRDEIGALVGALQSDVTGLKATAQKTTGRPLNAPEIDTGVAPTYRANKKNTGCFVSLGFKGPAEMVQLQAKMVPTAKRTDQATFNQNKFSGFVTEFTDQQRADLGVGGTVIAELDVLLDFSTQFDIFRLLSYFFDGSTVESPGVDVAYNDPPLYQFTTPSAASLAGAPSKPTSARIISNTVDANSDGSLSVATLRIYADETEVKTFLQQNTVSVQPKVVDGSGAKAPSPSVTVEDPSVTFVDDSIGGLLTGYPYTWSKNTAFDSNGQGTASLVNAITFIAGGFADPSDSLANLTLVSATTTTTDDPSLLLVTFTLHQPSPAYKLKNFTAKRKISANADSDYDLAKNLVVDRGDIRDPSFSTPGNIALTFPMNVKASKTYKVKITVRSIQGFTKDFISGDITTASTTVSAQVSAPGGGQSLILGGSLQASFKDYNDWLSGGGIAGDAIYPMYLWETASNSGTKIDNKAVSGGGSADAAGVRWDNTNARLECETNIVTLGGKPAARIGKLLNKNDAVILCPSFLSATADIVPDISFALVDQVAGDIVVATATAFPISHTAAGRGLWILVVPNSYTGTAKQWIEMRFGANPAQKVYTWNWQLDWGTLYRDFKLNGDEKAVLDFLDVKPVNSTVLVTGINTEDSSGNLYGDTGTRAGPISLA